MNILGVHIPKAIVVFLAAQLVIACAVTGVVVLAACAVFVCFRWVSASPSENAADLLRQVPARSDLQTQYGPCGDLLLIHRWISIVSA